VRPVQPDAEEERTLVAGEALEQPHRLARSDAVGLLGVGRVVGPPAERRAELAGLANAEDAVVDLAVVAAGVDREIPGQVVVEAGRADVVRHAVVVELADARDEPTVVLEELGERHRLGEALTEVWRQRARRARVRQHTRRIGPPSCHERRPAGAAQGVLRVRALEADSARGQGVDVRALDARPIGAQIHVEIVGDDEEDVQPARCRRSLAVTNGLRACARQRRRQAENGRDGAENRSFHAGVSLVMAPQIVSHRGPCG